MQGREPITVKGHDLEPLGLVAEDAEHREVELAKFQKIPTDVWLLVIKYLTPTEFYHLIKAYKKLYSFFLINQGLLTAKDFALINNDKPMYAVSEKICDGKASFSEYNVIPIKITKQALKAGLLASSHVFFTEEKASEYCRIFNSYFDAAARVSYSRRQAPCYPLTDTPKLIRLSQEIKNGQTFVFFKPKPNGFKTQFSLEAPKQEKKSAASKKR